MRSSCRHSRSLSWLLSLTSLIEIDAQFLLASSCLLRACLRNQVLFTIVFRDLALLMAINVHNNVSAALIVFSVIVTLIGHGNLMGEVLRLFLLLSAAHFRHLCSLGYDLFEFVEVGVGSGARRDATHLLLGRLPQIFQRQVHQLGHEPVRESPAQVRELNAKALLHFIAILELEGQFVDALVIARVALRDGLAQIELLDDLRELQLLEVLGNLLHLLLLVVLLLVKVHRHERRLDVRRRRHQDFFQPRDTQGHVCSTVAGQVEGIESHLGGGLAHGLSCDCAHVFTWVHNRLQILHVVHVFEGLRIDHRILVLRGSLAFRLELLAKRLFL